MKDDPLRFYVRMMNEYGDVVRLHFPNGTIHLITHPDDVRRVLQENSRGYSKRTPGVAKSRLIMGNGLVTSDGDFWRKQRRLAQPAFHREMIAKFSRSMEEATDEVMAGWVNRPRTSTIDLGRDMTKLTLRVVGEAILGADTRADANVVARAVAFLVTDGFRRLTSIVDLPLSVPTPMNRRFNAEMAALQVIIGRAIRARRSSPDDRSDFLAMMMHATDSETGDRMSDDQLRDEVMTMFLAGHETVASALVWTIYLLSTHPQTRTALREELARVTGGRPVSAPDLPQLTLLDQVVKESLRLYPPISHIGRRLIADDVLGGYAIESGTMVIVSPFATHRHPAIWSNPAGFEPSRFTKEADDARPRFAYIPFGGGPRVCIGNAFSMMELAIATGRIVQRYDVDVVPGAEVVPEMNMTVRPRHPLLARVLPVPPPTARAS